MTEVKLQDLLAPTWVERARADDMLFFSLGGEHEDINPWSEDVLKEVGELHPSPEKFLSALVAFWAEVSLQQHNDWMSQCGSKNKDAIDAALAARLASPYSALFPMTPAKPPISESMMRSWGALKLISRLGPYVPLIEKQLLACLEHPVSQIYDTAGRAFGTVDQISDEVYRQYLAFADRWGRGGFVRIRSDVLAKHMNEARLGMVLDGLVPNATERLVESRCRIIERLKGAHAQAALRHVLDHMDDGWSEAYLAKMIYVLVRLGQAVGMPEEAVPRMLALAHHANDDVRTEAVWFLANHSPSAHHALLLEKLDDPCPRVLDAIFNALALHADVPADLLRRAAARGLGNYDGHDDEPHYSAMTMVKSSAAHARIALPEIAAWWEKASGESWLDNNEIGHVLEIVSLLGAEAAVLKPGLERALAQLTAPEEEQEELPAINEPGAVPIIQAKLEEGMREAGNPPELVAAGSQFYGGLLNYLAENADEWQKEIDEKQERREAEMRELYPELYAEKPDVEEAGAEEEFEPEEYEDEMVVRLREAIARL